jgi:hypothetical protein
MKLPVVAVLGAVVLVVTSCAQSQASVNDCERAIEVVRRGQPASQEERAWTTLPSCGAEGAVAARDAWTSLRSVADSSLIAKVYDRVRSFRDSSLFGAARAVLLDSTATAEARVSSAMLVVAQLYDDADPDYRVFSTTGAHDVCAIGSTTDRSRRDGAPLPPHARALAESTALRVLTDASAAQPVRNAARCVYDAVAPDGSVLAQRTPAPNPAEHVSESAGRLDSARTSSVRDTQPRARPRSPRRMRQRVDSIRGVVAFEGGGGGCVVSQPYLETSAGTRVGLDGSRDVISQMTGRELVVFGRETDLPHQPVYLPHPLFTVDSFFVRAYEGKRVHDGILRRGPRGHVLETRDSGRLPVANLPRALEKADGMRVWIAEPLGTPTVAGVIEPAQKLRCEG